MSARLIAVWTVTLVSLGSVFVAYLQPDLALALATQLWTCF